MNSRFHYGVSRLLRWITLVYLVLGFTRSGAWAQPAAAKKAVITWPASQSKDVVKYDIHYGTVAGFAISNSTLRGVFNVADPPAASYSYEHPATLAGDKHYYKVRTFDPKLERPTVSKEVAILKSGADTYVFNLTYKEGSRLRAVAGGTEISQGADDTENLGDKWNDPWHQAQLLLNITVSKNGVALAKAQSFDFSFESNPGNNTTAPQRAALIDVATKPDTPAQWANNTLPGVAAATDLKQQFSRSTNGDADIVVRVVSGQKITQPKLVVQWKDEEGTVYDVTKITLDFVAAQSLRRFGVPLFGEFTADKDNGWAATPDIINSPGQIVTMTLHLKFHAVESQGVTTYPIVAYVDTQPQPQPPLSADAADWKPVGGHKLQISIAEVLRKVAQSGAGNQTSYYNKLLPENSPEVPNFVFFVDGSDEGFLIDENGVRLQADGHDVSDVKDFPNYAEVKPKYLNVTTGSDGTATVHLKAGFLIEKCLYFGLRVKDITQKK